MEIEGKKEKKKRRARTSLVFRSLSLVRLASHLVSLALFFPTFFLMSYPRSLTSLWYFVGVSSIALLFPLALFTFVAGALRPRFSGLVALALLYIFISLLSLSVSYSRSHTHFFVLLSNQGGSGQSIRGRMDSASAKAAA